MSNNKIGFNYYPVDTDRYFDSKIRRLKKNHGCKGIAVYDYILCEIYRDKGCFIMWDADTAFDVAEYFGLEETTVDEIVNYCCYVGLFDKELLVNERVLTSHSIQERFTEMSLRAKRKNFKIPEKYKIIQEESFKLPEESIENSDSLPQSKVKESKVKKEENIKEAFLKEKRSGENFSEEEKTMFKNFQNWINENSPRINQLKKPLTISEYLKIKKKISTDTLIKICLAMENKADLLKKYTSAYLTILSWADNRKDELPKQSPVIEMDEVAKKIFSKTKN
jgi:hypothetical protein